MAGFLVYLPGKVGCGEEHLRAAGLAALCGEPGYTVTDGVGPDGGRGILGSWHHGLDDGRNAELRYEPERQRWEQVEGREAWLGVWTDTPVRPQDLERRKLHPGADVILEDGQAWHVPIARQLPHLLGIGKPRVVDRYRPFYEATLARINEWLHEGPDGPTWRINFHRAFEFACLALAVNYHVSPEVVTFLQLVSTENVFAVIDVVTEGLCTERIRELVLQKKTAELASTAAGSSSGGGAPG